MKKSLEIIHSDVFGVVYPSGDPLGSLLWKLIAKKIWKRCRTKKKERIKSRERERDKKFLASQRNKIKGKFRKFQRLRIDE